MARGGAGSDTGRKLPPNWPRTEAFIVWSYWRGKWWRVDGGPDPAAMHLSAVNRLRTCRDTTVRPHNPHGVAINPDARFVATDKWGDPQQAWEAMP